MITDSKHLRYMLMRYLTIEDIADEIADKVHGRICLQSLLIAILEQPYGVDTVATAAYECRELRDVRDFINASMNKATLKLEEALRQEGSEATSEFEKWLDSELERLRMGQTRETTAKTSVWRGKALVDLTGTGLTDVSSTSDPRLSADFQPGQRPSTSDTNQKRPNGPTNSNGNSLSTKKSSLSNRNQDAPNDQSTPKPNAPPVKNHGPSDTTQKNQSSNAKPRDNPPSTKRPLALNTDPRHLVDYSDLNADPKRSSTSNTAQESSNDRQKPYPDPPSPKRQRFNPPKGPSNPHAPRNANLQPLGNRAPPPPLITPASRPQRHDLIAERNANTSRPNRHPTTPDSPSLKRRIAHQRPYETASLPVASYY